MTAQFELSSHVSLRRQFLCPARLSERSPAVVAVILLLALYGCNPLVSRFTSRAIDQLGESTQPVVHKIAEPIRADVGLSLLWVGHATVLIQIHDKVLITDPVFANTIGLLARRSIGPGIDANSISHLNAVLISHIHMDHFNYSSLGLLPRRARLFVPSGGVPYTPEFGFRETLPVRPWQVFEEDGLRITAVPVQHFGGRYGFDAGWNAEPSWTGYVIEYKGTTVLFAGDTAYNPDFFKEIGRRFHVDVALIPIAPVEPREFMSRVHVDPQEAIQIFEDVGATLMIPIHHDTFFQGLEPTPSYAKTLLRKLMEEHGLRNRVKILEIGEQVILKE